MQQAIEQKILSRIYDKGRGWAFSQADFADLGACSIGSQLEVPGPFSLEGMIEVTSQSQRYAVFRTDFKERVCPSRMAIANKSAA